MTQEQKILAKFKALDAAEKTQMQPILDSITINPKAVEFLKFAKNGLEKIKSGYSIVDVTPNELA